MKALKAIAITTVLVAFVGCDDDWIMDLEPPYGGYIWRVTNRGGGYIASVDPLTGDRLEGGGSTPFPGGDYEYPCGHNYDAAAGDGKVWVAGAVYDNDDQVYYFRIWEVGTPSWELFSYVACFGLTYDGDYLWAAELGNREGDIWDFVIEFYRINPDTHVTELMFVIDIPDDYYEGLQAPAGLAWDGDYLWLSTKTNNAIQQIDRQTGEVLHTTVLSPQIGNPRGLAWDGEALWVNDIKTDILYRVSSKDGSILGYHEMSPTGRLPPPAPYGLAFEFPSE